MIRKILTASIIAVSMAANACAADYTVNSPPQFVFGEPTSVTETVDINAPNDALIDRSKNSALIPPVFGSKTSFLRGSGEPLTPNLTSEYSHASESVKMTVSTRSDMRSDSVFITDTYIPPVSDGRSGYYYGGETFTEVSEDMYYSSGYLGILEIPAIDVKVKIYEGTSNASLAKGAGHFENTSIWNGNVCLAAHNRGTNAYFGEIHTLDNGDEVILTTKRGSRTYRVFNVEKISVNDTSNLQTTRDNIITLITCVKGEADYYRWCVQASAY